MRLIIKKVILCPSETWTGSDGVETTATAFVPTRNTGERMRMRILKEENSGVENSGVENNSKDDSAAITNVCLTFNLTANYIN